MPLAPSSRIRVRKLREGRRPQRPALGNHVGSCSVTERVQRWLTWPEEGKNPKRLERSAGNKPPRDKESLLMCNPVVLLSYVHREWFLVNRLPQQPSWAYVPGVTWATSFTGPQTGQPWSVKLKSGPGVRQTRVWIWTPLFSSCVTWGRRMPPFLHP